MKKKISVDLVALVLAIALGISVVLIMTAVIINVVSKRSPTPTLGENATQILTAIIGGLIGVLGGYIGAKVRNGRDRDE